MSGGYRVPAVVSAAKILRELRRASRPMTQAELVRATGLSKSSMHNLLSTLEGEGLVSRDDRSREYRLGPALIVLGAAASGQARLIDLASERLAPLAGERQISFAIAQPLGSSEVVIVERFYPPTGVHVGIRIGSTFGLYDGALGKCLLAGLPEDALADRLAAKPIPAHTERTLTEPGELLAEVARVRESGWAASEQELNENNAVAAPLRGRNGSIELILLALGFAEELGGEEVGRTGELLAAIAEEIRVGAGLVAAGEADETTAIAAVG
ncbi:MAG: IclR family transcriptional regulator [Thermoleophilia bacterium]|nr:IclR family transcriptional regulator [Thermoleophilia bacterium]